VACDPLLVMFRRVFLYLKMEFAGKILVKAYDKGEIAKNKEEVASKYAFCTSLRHYVPESTLYTYCFLSERVRLECVLFEASPALLSYFA
jgi:hypothetical protein